MFSPFRMGPAASGRGLCDIDRVLFKVTQSRVGKRGVLARRPLAAGQIRNAKSIESLLVIGYNHIFIEKISFLPDHLPHLFNFCHILVRQLRR